MKAWIDERVGAARVWLRERKERAAEKRAEQARDQHIHSRFWLLQVPALATICAAIVEWYWALLFCIEATGHIDWNYETSFGSEAQTQALWNFGFSAHWPVLVGLICATAPIVMLSMIWLPVQFAMRGAGRWRRGSIIAVGLLANVLVIVSGTVVMNYNRQEQVREALVVEQTAAAGRGAIEAQIAAVNDDLARLTDRRVNNEYAATAANVGAVAYRAQYMSEEALARSPAARRDIIVRALGAAERADALRAERSALFQQLAQAPTEAAVAANVNDTVGRELNTFAQYVEVWRPPFIAFICTLIGIFGAWWTLAMLERLNPRDVLRSGWADEGHRIEDLREQEAVVPQPMRPAREVVTDAETGEELVKVRPKEYWRKRVTKKGKPTQVEVEPEPMPDEVGVAHDGGGRMASVAASHQEERDPAKEQETRTNQSHDKDAAEEAGDGSIAEPLSDDSARDGERGEQQQETHYAEHEIILSDEEIAAIDGLTDTPVEPVDEPQQQDDSSEPDQQSEHVELPENEGVMIAHEEPEREPETDPSRLIAAE